MAVAFWHYDLFPYILSGHVTKRGVSVRDNKTPIVEVKEYGPGFWEAPMFELSDKQGDKLAAKLKALGNQRRAAAEALDREYMAKLKLLLLEYGMENTAPARHYPRFAPIAART